MLTPTCGFSTWLLGFLTRGWPASLETGGEGEGESQREREGEAEEEREGKREREGEGVRWKIYITFSDLAFQVTSSAFNLLGVSH